MLSLALLKILQLNPSSILKIFVKCLKIFFFFIQKTYCGRALTQQMVPVVQWLVAWTQLWLPHPWCL